MTRDDTYSLVAATLANLSDGALFDLVEAARPLGSGIGGTSALLTIEERPVFVKKVPLTVLESQPGNVMSTANLFDLPLYCQYRIGSPGFGVWREVAAHIMTTDWVLGGKCANFPVMYHWRIIRDAQRESGNAAQNAGQLAELEHAVQFWGDSSAMRRRLVALHESAAHVVLFVEYFPQNLQQWLSAKLAEGGPAADSAVRCVDDALSLTNTFMDANGLIHFDAHFENILTDGERLYFSDFGLALSSEFDLTLAEQAFFDRHRCFDAANAAMSFVNCLITSSLGANRWEELQACLDADGARVGLSPAIETIIRRDGPVALALKAFFRGVSADKLSPFPADRIASLLAKSRIQLPFTGP